MKPLIIYHTKTNNTTAIAKAIAEELLADCYLATELPESELEGRLLIGFATGTYNTMPAKEIRAIIPKVPKNAKVFFVFTSGFTNNFLVNIYRSRYNKLVKKHQLGSIGMWNCPGHDKHPLFKWLNLNVGRPNAEDLANARKFVASLTVK